MMMKKTWMCLMEGNCHRKVFVYYIKIVTQIFFCKVFFPKGYAALEIVRLKGPSVSCHSYN